MVIKYSKILLEQGREALTTEYKGQTSLMVVMVMIMMIMITVTIR